MTADYEAKFELVMPGMSRPSFFVVTVKNAANGVEAMSLAIEEWKRATEPRDVRVKEIQVTP